MFKEIVTTAALVGLVSCVPLKTGLESTVLNPATEQIQKEEYITKLNPEAFKQIHQMPDKDTLRVVFIADGQPPGTWIYKKLLSQIKELGPDVVFLVVITHVMVS